MFSVILKFLLAIEILFSINVGKIRFSYPFYVFLLSYSRHVKVNSFRNFFKCKIFLHFNFFLSKKY